MTCISATDDLMLLQLGRGWTNHSRRSD